MKVFKLRTRCILSAALAFAGAIPVMASGLPDFSQAERTQSKTAAVSKAMGKVVDSNGEPMIGVTVLCKSCKNVAGATDLDGNFVLANVPLGAVLKFSSVGCLPVEKKWEGKALSVVLKDDNINLDEVVVVGYSSTTKRDLISSVSNVKSEELSGLPSTNIIQSLAGRAPGMIVTAHGGGVNSRPSVMV